MKSFIPLVRRTTLRIFLFSLVFMFQITGSKAQVTEADSISLVALYWVFNGNEWYYSNHWLEQGYPVGQWEGIKVEEGRVVEINLPNNNIQATFPENFSEDNLNSFIGSWTIGWLLDDPIYFANNVLPVVTQLFQLLSEDPLGKLRRINLSGNKISGYIPEEIEKVSYLQELNLSNNYFEGSIPQQIGNLKNLAVLNLSNNNFNSGLKNVCNAESLTYLSLHHNELGGEIPREFENLSNLEHLELHNNSLSGEIRWWFYDLQKLNYLTLHKNLFSGEILPQIRFLEELTYLNLSVNQFTNQLPDVFENLTQLEQIILHENQFTGDVPISFGTLTNLTNLRLEKNRFVNLPELNNVKWQLHCYDNSLTFEDFEKSLDMIWDSGVGDKIYHPQDSIGEEEEYWVQEGTWFSIAVPCGGKYNRYNWYKDGSSYSGPLLTDTLYFSPIRQGDEGEYYVKITNDSVPNLEIVSRTITIHIQNSCLYADSLALVAFYEALDGDNWTNNTNWLTGPVSSWLGITLSDDGCNVTEIGLGENNLTGEFPPELYTLTSLVSIDVPFNNISGTIAPGIGNLTQLQHIGFGRNQLTGSIPPEIGNLTELVDLWLENHLTGEIPVEIGNLTKLETLALGTNDLSGQIPTTIGNLTSLINLWLDQNNLTGPIPSGIGNLENLSNMNLKDNDLSGPIPASFGRLSNLRWLDMGGNRLQGQIPDAFWDMSNLENLYLGDNELEGNLSPRVGNLTQLTYIDLTLNQFSGQIPGQLGDISPLTGIVLRNNQFSGEVPGSIGTLPNLQDFRIEDNQLWGLPDLNNVQNQFTCDSNFFTFEDFENNQALFQNGNIMREVSPQYEFEEEITISIVEGNELTLSRLCGGTANHYTWIKDGSNLPAGPDNDSLTFTSVQLTDAGDYWVTVTSDYGFDNLVLTSQPIHLIVEEHCLKQDSLALVALYNATGGDNWKNNENWLESPVETWFGINGLTANGCNVTQINLDWNNLTGTLPPEICTFEYLTLLRLGANLITGNIPGNIGDLTNLETLILNDNQLSGSLPNSLWDLHKLKILDIRNNDLTGSISQRLGELTNLEWLDLEANFWSGGIPEEIGNLRKLEYFSIAHTPITGLLPDEIGNLTELTELRLNVTDLYGQLPQSLTQLNKLDTFNIQYAEFSGHIPDLSTLNELDYFNSANNLFLFGDIDAAKINTGKVEFTYAPQDTILHLEELYQSRQITIIDDDFAGNVYHWYLNDVLYEEGSDVLDLTETGMYYCHVTNPAFPELTLYSDTLYIDDIMPYYDDVEPVNLVIIDGAHPPEFYITNIDLYPDNSLFVFNRWGQKVYERSSYNNDLDFSTYPEGTYYYVLNYVKPDGPKQVKSFVDVVKE
ncbi:MAG: gliding motility-associated C-terminal domain-containing protein [Prolixibacteraceae bacterium]|nr:gliding motility-associated C-terminal domain-containing protein [Prolixibacteraceae bacterium]